MKKVCAVIMASGYARRFGGNKYLTEFCGKPLIEHCFRAVKDGGFAAVAVVARQKEILALAENYGFIAVRNRDETNDTAVTIRCGVEAVGDGADGVALFVADQPFFKSSKKLRDFFIADSTRICAVCRNGQRGNPVIFPTDLLEELKTLSPGGRGRDVIRRHTDRLSLCEVGENELFDIDTPDDLAVARNLMK